jgi:hypothetical protein
MAIAGWVLWENLPQHHEVDASAEISEQCDTEESAIIYAVGEKAYQACLVKWRRENFSVTKSPVGPFAPEAICEIEKTSASLSAKAKSDAYKAKGACVDAKAGSITQRLQLDADQAVDEAKFHQMIFWSEKVFLAPLPLPGVIVLFLYVAWYNKLVAKWVSSGYKS